MLNLNNYQILVQYIVYHNQYLLLQLSYNHYYLLPNNLHLIQHSNLIYMFYIYSLHKFKQLLFINYMHHLSKHLLVRNQYYMMQHMNKQHFIIKYQMLLFMKNSIQQHMLLFYYKFNIHYYRLKHNYLLIIIHLDYLSINNYQLKFITMLLVKHKLFYPHKFMLKLLHHLQQHLFIKFLMKNRIKQHIIKHYSKLH